MFTISALKIHDLILLFWGVFVYYFSVENPRFNIDFLGGVCLFTISALKIHVSPQCKEVLDTFSTFDLEFRGNIEMKVSMGITWVPERERERGGRKRERER